MTDTKGPRIIVALDYARREDALALAGRLDPARCRLKVGKELFTIAGPELVRDLVRQGFGVFLDLKFHDIPNTVASACKAAADLGVWMLNVHASGGRAMLKAARKAIPQGANAPRLIAVTILTSLSGAELADIGLRGTPEENALRLAGLARECDFDGVVCSAAEAPAIRRACGEQFALVTPGIRPPDVSTDDQARVMTPAAAIAAGAHYLVIGRAITQAREPLAMLGRIEAEIAGTIAG